MIPRTLARLAEITGGDLFGIDPAAAAGVVIDGPVVTDSREAGLGSLYVARIGASLDGHDFAGRARDAGAVAALTTRTITDLPGIVVPDEQAAFVAIARDLVDRADDLRVIGITGSSGKTSTKDLLAQVLAAAAPTVANVGSLNSEVGVPLTVCRLEPDTRFLVVEMGARGIGHIHYLTTIAPPAVGIVLNVGSAHVGEFGSRQGIATAKAELVEALPTDGVAILNADDDLVAAMAARTRARVVLVGENAGAHVRATDISLNADGRASFTLTADSDSVPVSLAVAGRHQVGNALAVIAAALVCGLDLSDIVATLAGAGPVSRYRMEVTTRDDGVTIVNDAYNANPESMAAALAALSTMATGRRAWAVLGPMLELGDESDAAHRATGADVARRGVERLIVVGAAAAEIAVGADAAYDRGDLEIDQVATTEEALAILSEQLRPGDIVLIKSSNGAGLRFLGDQLLSPEALR
ncbi:MAG: UDP-N-acetylmuramoyl-tripeptide--D-alanyl-D-alanine ligase [Tetrasphaera jenkinsii]|jgi:UDP-N-acetylmuramoyl-tripeptide--D-alanyl-D-alanine ligase|nr:UDP-N-acetylmuramoyl-tripeptide--D-alanyl-D-alanine ligase [Tetrasphaera jenkinsii]